jgi:tripartite-type tricarboxylate transporter receptor subunit TctC
MKLVRTRRIIWLLWPALWVVSTAGAQNYPTKAIRFLVGNAPGGGTDLIARTLSQKLYEAWGHSVVVEHRPGATGAVAAVTLARAAPDGYTLMIVTSSSHAIAPALQSDLPYHPVRDYAPIALVATAPQILVAHPALAANTVKELIALAKAKPGALNYASSGTGTLGYMTAELLKSVTQTDIVHIPYKGTGSAVIELLGGQVQLMFSAPGAVIQQVRAGKLKSIAVASAKRPAGLEDVTTFAEAGYPAIEASNWYAILTTVGTPRPIVDKLNQGIVRIVRLPEVKESFFTQGYEATSSTPQELAQLIKNDLAKWQKVVKAAGARKN